MNNCYTNVNAASNKSGGEGGIRTLGTGISQYNGLANRRIRPLCHLSDFAAKGLSDVARRGRSQGDEARLGHEGILTWVDRRWARLRRETRSYYQDGTTGLRAGGVCFPESDPSRSPPGSSCPTGLTGN